MKNSQAIYDSIKDSILTIKELQASDGGFASLSSFYPDDFARSIEYRTTFFTANILTCLNISEALVREEDIGFEALYIVRAAAAHFLLGEKSVSWSFNYWAHDTNERITMPYPDDLDDTFVALVALHGYDAKLIDGGVLARAAKLLVALEVEPGGPYRTWLVESAAGREWQDVDLVVNSNIAYFLSGIDIALPKIERWINGRISQCKLHSPYYPGVVQVIYFMSRCYRGEQKAKLFEMLLAERMQDGLWKNSLETAMAISAIISFGYTEKVSADMIEAFLVSIKTAGFQPYAFCIDPCRDGRTSYAGSPALTAAFCVEALVKYITSRKSFLLNNSEERGSIKEYTSSSDVLFAKIKMVAQSHCYQLPGGLKNAALDEIENIKNEEIGMVPYIMRYAFGFPGSMHLDIIEKLALANLYGWIAYTIYDDFLDGEGDPVLLSVANFFLRKLTFDYTLMNEDIVGIQDCFERIMDGIDAANICEQTQCRTVISGTMLTIPQELPYASFDTLADRSLGHALPALGVCMLAGFSPESREFQNIQSFFKEYLIARQLHDDAHDWQEDLARGHINSCGARILARWRHEYRNTADINPRGNTIDLSITIPQLQNVFWESVIVDVIREMKEFLAKARDKLRDIPLMKNPQALEALLDRLASSADRTLGERAEAISFLEVYR
jgi:hypothetical protein